MFAYKILGRALSSLLLVNSFLGGRALSGVPPLDRATSLGVGGKNGLKGPFFFLYFPFRWVPYMWVNMTDDEQCYADLSKLVHLMGLSTHSIAERVTSGSVGRLASFVEGMVRDVQDELEGDVGLWMLGMELVHIISHVGSLLGLTLSEDSQEYLLQTFEEAFTNPEHPVAKSILANIAAAVWVGRSLRSHLYLLEDSSANMVSGDYALN